MTALALRLLHVASSAHHAAIEPERMVILQLILSVLLPALTLAQDCSTPSGWVCPLTYATEKCALTPLTITEYDDIPDTDRT